MHATVSPALNGAFERLEQQLAHWVGHRHMTALLYDLECGEAERVFSSDPATYPATGRKPFTQGPIMMRVRDTARPYVAIDRRALIRDFPDHQKIFAMGCESLVNLPLIVGGAVIGQVNLLHEQDFYTQEKVELAMSFVSITSTELSGLIANQPLFD